MDQLRETPSVLPRRATARHVVEFVAVFACALCLCGVATPGVAQISTPSATSPDDTQRNSEALIAQLDHLLAEQRSDEADSVYRQLLKARASAVAAGLRLVSSGGSSTERTVGSLCDLASKEVPAEMSSAVLEYALGSTSASDAIAFRCVRQLGKYAGGSLRDPILQVATNPVREVNLRIAALKAATSKWPLESQPTLVQLLRSAQEPIMHHKAQQYLAHSESPDALSAIEQFVQNRDPATEGSALSKEYGLLMLRFRQPERVVPLLASILRDESWPSELQDRAIDLLAHSDLPGGREVLEQARAHASSTLRSRMDALVKEEE